MVTRLALLALLLAWQPSAARAAATSCAQSVQQFSTVHGNAVSPHPDAQLMLYFLHIPRTAGRTYHSCFLKLGSPPSRRCEKSYDMLRIDRSLEGCGLLSSHDDLSTSTLLPANAAFATQIRDPVDRVISAYEFSIEVAARGAFRKERTRVDPLMTNTKDVWPWSVLVPWMEEDLRQRRASLDSGATKWGDAAAPLHDSPIVMPLREWIEHPAVQGVIHNGETLQVLGLTNYSRWQDAGAVRSCLADSPTLGEKLLPLALASLRKFAHVGCTEQLVASIQSLAATMGMLLDGPAWEANTIAAFEEDPVTAQVRKKIRLAHRRITSLGKKVDTEGALTDVELRVARDQLDRAYAEQDKLKQQLAELHSRPKQVKPDSTFQQKVPLWKAFRACEHKARLKNSKRRASSLAPLRGEHGQRMQFTHEARGSIQPAVLARIRELNSLDVALHEEAQQLLAAKLASQRAAGLLKELPQLSEADKKRVERQPKRSLKGSGAARESPEGEPGDIDWDSDVEGDADEGGSAADAGPVTVAARDEL